MDASVYSAASGPNGSASFAALREQAKVEEESEPEAWLYKAHQVFNFRDLVDRAGLLV